MPESLIPTEKLAVSVPDNANEEILVFASKLVAEGKRPWFEVRYPAPEALSPDEQAAWLEAQEAVYDAVEVVNDDIYTLPPYSTLLEEGEGN
jgi:hypothetical protein